MEGSKTTEISKNFTGVIIPISFVKDTLISLRFYQDVCGFTLIASFDNELGREVKDWQNAEPPIFIRIATAAQEFMLHINNGEFSSVGGNLHYIYLGN